MMRCGLRRETKPNQVLQQTGAACRPIETCRSRSDPAAELVVRRQKEATVQPPTSYVWLDAGWFAWLEFGSDNPHATRTAIAKRVTTELGWRVEDYYPNDPEEGTEYADIFVGNELMLGLTSKSGIVSRIGSDGPRIPFLLRIAALYGAECRGWRWRLFRLWKRLIGRRQDAEPTAAPDMAAR
jgi:hypothetical protein